MSTDNSIHQIVLANVKRMREERGWNKSELARITEIDASHISNIENGKKHMSLELVARIAKAYEVEPYEMLRPYSLDQIGLGHKMEMIEKLHPIKKQAIEQMVNAFLNERQLEE